MRRLPIRLAIACGCTLAAAAFSGGALAGNGHGGGSDHGNGGQSPSWQTQSPATDQTQSGPSQSSHDDHGSATQDDTQQAGVKPSSTTKHWTKTTVGAKPDVSKRYGNGKTAAEIAKSRGAPDDTVLTGPGNSQPHKVSVCGKPSNRSGGVDVHAVKSYDSSRCEEKTHEHAAAGCSGGMKTWKHGRHTGESSCGAVKSESPCACAPHVERPLVKPQCSGSMHGDHGKHEGQSPGCASTETHVVVASTTTVVTPAPAPAVVTTTTQAPAQVVGQTVTVTTTTPAGTVTTPAASAPAPAPAQAPAANASAPTGGVLGARANVPKPSSPSGVLGTASNVAGTTLPFTGFPLWIAVIVALGLIGAGFVLRRRGAARI